MAVDPDHRAAIGLQCDQQEIVWALTHVKARLKLALRHHAPTGNVSYAVFGDALWIQNDVRCELPY
eukprot:COSAG02_NODE_67089_length_254_cov_0.283871_1_plen_65_part_01